MSKARNLADLLEAGGDVKLASLDNAPAPSKSTIDALGIAATSVTGTQASDITANNAKVTNYNQTKADIEALGIAASSITGALPAISGANLTNLPASGATSLNGLSDVTVSSSAPTGSTNPTSIGHFWLDTTQAATYICAVNTPNANIWNGFGAPSVISGTRIVYTSSSTEYAYFSPVGTAYASTFGSILSSKTEPSFAQSTTRAVLCGVGLEYITIQTLGNGVSFGSLAYTANYVAATSDGSRGIIAGGYSGFNEINYITIATIGNAADFGDLTVARGMAAATSGGGRGLIGGGFGPAFTSAIDYITIANTGNASNFGYLSYGYNYAMGATSNGSRAVFCGGSASPTSIDYVTIASTGNANAFGTLTASYDSPAATSDGTYAFVAKGSNVDKFNISSIGNSSLFGALSPSARDAACYG